MNKYLKNIYRSVLANKFSYIGVVLIIAMGIMVYIAIIDYVQNLQIALEKYDSAVNFADVNVKVESAPQKAVDAIEEIEGVSAAFGRLETDARLLTENSDKIVTVHLMAYDSNDDINKLILNGGKPAEREIYLSPKMAGEHGFKKGDILKFSIGGKEYSLKYSGDAYSLSFMGACANSEAPCDFSTYDMAAVDKTYLENMLQKNGLVTNIGIKTKPEYDYKDVRFDIEKSLEKYGISEINEKIKSSGYYDVDSEIKTMRTISYIVPPAFLTVTVFLLYVMLKKMIDKDRIIIGTMKAFGISDSQMFAAYSVQGVVIGLAGGLLPIVFGELAGEYLFVDDAVYYNLLFADGYTAIPSTIISGVLISLVTSMLSVILAVASVVKIKPAESMRAAAPSTKGTIALPKAVDKLLNTRQKIGMRAIFRNPFRNLVIATAIAFPLIITAVMGYIPMVVQDAFVKQFGEIQAYDMFASLENYTEKNKATDVIGNVEHVTKCETCAIYYVKIKNRNRSRYVSLQVLDDESTLFNVCDINGKAYDIPSNGLLLDKKDADKIGLKAGDIAEINNVYLCGSNEGVKIPVIATPKESMTGKAFISESGAQKYFKISGVCNNVYISVPDKDIPKVSKTLAKLGNVSYIAATKTLKDLNIETFDTLTMLMIGIVLFTAVAGVVMIYNIMYISAMERKNEFGTLSVLGMSSGEISEIVIFEQIINFIGGVIIAIPFIKILEHFFEHVIDEAGLIVSLNTPLFMYAIAFGLCAAITAVSTMRVIKFILGIQLTDVLKERE